MSNEVLWLVLMLVNFGCIIAAYKWFGKAGLFSWIAIATVMANIEVLKTIELFGFVTTLGNIMYGTTFLCTDILSEKYGRKEAAKGVWIGFFSLFAITGIMQLCLLFIPHASDFANPALKTIFSIMPRVAAGSAIAYLLSQTHDVWAFEFWKKRFPSHRHLWIRNNASTMVSQLIDTGIFCTIAFLGVFPMDIFWNIMFTTYALKWIVAACDTPFIYLATQITPKE